MPKGLKRWLILFACYVCGVVVVSVGAFSNVLTLCLGLLFGVASWLFVYHYWEKM